VRIGDLSKATGVPVPTIKYYQRESLLPYGERVGYNQTRYADEHVHRLRLVRALVEVGRLPIAAARDVLAAIDEPGVDLFDALGKVHYTITATPAEPSAETGRVDDLLGELGWQVSATNPNRAALAALLGSMSDLNQTGLLNRLQDYAALAGKLAELDISLLDEHDNADEVLETAVVATLLGDVLVSLLRHMAQESISTRFASPDRER
jgi:DNA-binding transcriptional MerR regulator